MRALELKAGYDFAAPDGLIPECANTLWKKVSRRELPAADARDAFQLLVEIPLEELASRALAAETFQISLSLDHPAYDCFYLAAAIKLETSLVTADRRLIQKLLSTGKSWATLAKPIEHFL